MLKQFCKHIGLILIIIGTLILLGGFFTHCMDSNAMLVISLVFIFGGLAAYIFFNKYIV